MILLQTHHCPYFTGPAQTFPDQQELLEFLFPCAALAVPGAQVLDFSALGRELWGDTGKWHRAPRQCLPSPVPSPRALVGGHCWVLETQEHQGAFPGPGWFLHPRDAPAHALPEPGTTCSALQPGHLLCCKPLNDTSLLHKNEAIFTTVWANDV